MRDHYSLPSHVPEQIALYQTHHLLTHDICRFDPARAADALQSTGEVLAVDIGGDKIRAAMYGIGAGRFTKRTERFVQSRGGAAYLPFLESLAEEAQCRQLPVGISCATKMDGSTISRTVNLPIFLEEFRQGYGADFRNLFPGILSVTNDTIAGLCGSTMLLRDRGRNIQAVAFVICASGLGAAVLKNGSAIHVEVAHVPLVDALNPLDQTRQCGVEGRSYVCVERVTAARAGIEDLYFRQTGEARDGMALGQMFDAGDALASLLYTSSALALAHATAGVAERYAFPGSPHSVVVFHGGNFEIARYRNSVAANLTRLPGFRTDVVFSRDLSPNVCLDGAAVLAVYAGA